LLPLSYLFKAMAVISKFEATISIDGKVAPEFDAEEDELENNTVVKYIECTTGAKFRFNFTVHPVYEKRGYLAWETYIDGQEIPGPVTTEKDLPRTRRASPARANLDGIHLKDGRQWTRSNFKFSDISFGLFTFNGKLKASRIGG
jgi:hypothetical protein